MTAHYDRKVYTPAGDTSVTPAVGPMSSPPSYNGARRVPVAEDDVLLAGRIAEGLRDAGRLRPEPGIINRCSPRTHGDRGGQSPNDHNFPPRDGQAGLTRGTGKRQSSGGAAQRRRR